MPWTKAENAGVIDPITRLDESDPEAWGKVVNINVRFQSSGQILRWPFQVGDRVIEIQPNDHIVVDVSDAVVATLVAGGGIGMAPTYVAAPHVQRGELVPVLAEYAVDRAPITALWPHSRGDSPNVEVFVRFLREHFPGPGRHAL